MFRVQQVKITRNLSDHPVQGWQISFNPPANSGYSVVSPWFSMLRRILRPTLSSERKCHNWIARYALGKEGAVAAPESNANHLISQTPLFYIWIARSQRGWFSQSHTAICPGSCLLACSFILLCDKKESYIYLIASSPHLTKEFPKDSLYHVS